MKKLFITITSALLISTTFYFIFAFNSNNTQPSLSQKPKVLFTDVHPFHSGGLFSFVVAIVSSDLNQDFEFAVAAPETSDIYKACKNLGITTYS